MYDSFRKVLNTIPKSSLYSYLDVITSEQIRAARAIVRMTVNQLSQSAGIGVATIKRLEAVTGVPPAQARTLSSLQIALESAGVEFVGKPDDRPGVRLRSSKKQN
jgi:DNA-binding Xre family transcriptional regulator